MGLELFLALLVAASIVTGLVTEAVKRALTEHNRSYRANTLAGIVAICVTAAIGVGFVIIADIAVTSTLIIYLIALVIASWVGAMIGYDKVIQTISQFKTSRED